MCSPTNGLQNQPLRQMCCQQKYQWEKCTIIWHVDDVKISHIDHDVNMSIIRELEKNFGELSPVTGQKHDYLGMDVELCENKIVKIGLLNQLKQTIDAFPEKVNRKVRAAAGHGLFSVDLSSTSLSPDKADIFHSIVAKLLWMMKRSRPDIEPVISFLTTRVSAPTDEDWQKLKLLMQCLNSTVDDVRIIGADNLSTLYTWIDAACAVHPNMCSHAGGCASFGLGITHSRSTKQKLNAKSSAESELVGLSEYSPFNTHLLHFMEVQGFKLTSNKMCQDNQSAIKMEKNGRYSCAGNSRHIHIRYFFVKDRADKNEMQIEYCPTASMLANFFKKHLHGSLFEKFKRVIMGYDHISILKSSMPKIKERVEDNEEYSKIYTF